MDKITIKKEEKKGTVLFKLSLYFISLWLLMFMLIILKVNISALNERFSLEVVFKFMHDNIFSGVCLCIIILGVIGYIHFKDNLQSAKHLPVRIAECESVNYENLAFLATYIIPLVCFPMETNREVFVLFTVIVVIGCIFVKTNLYYTNPSLVLLVF